MAAPSMFDPWLERWNLSPDGEALKTLGGWLLPVRSHGRPAMLKLASNLEERRGGALMAWWDGQGAVPVLAQEGEALLLARAQGSRCLAAMARDGHDDEATDILCAAAGRLHAGHGGDIPADLVALPDWFAALKSTAARHGGVLARAYATSRALLNDPYEVVVLHGDIHHANVLEFADGDWRAIDPKALIGERGFDYANILCNPDPEIAATPGRLARQAERIADAAGLELGRLAAWTLAYAGLSASWTLAAGGDPRPALEIARAAAALSPEL